MRTHRDAWNKGRLPGQKPPLKPKEIWSIRSACNWQTEYVTWLCTLES